MSEKELNNEWARTNKEDVEKRKEEKREEKREKYENQNRRDGMRRTKEVVMVQLFYSDRCPSCKGKSHVE